MDMDSLIYDIETEDFYKDITEDVKDRFDTSGYNPDGYCVPGTGEWSHGTLEGPGSCGPIDPYL